MSGPDAYRYIGLETAADNAFMIDLPIIESNGFTEDRSSAGHVCGPCTACCVWLTVPAGEVSVEEKPAGVACPHVRADSGCRIYADRPGTCHSFRCAWLADEQWPASWRPHESGLLCLRETLDDDLPAALVYEIRAGALLEPVTAEILDELLRTTFVVAVVNFQKQNMRLPGRWRRDAAKPRPPRPHFVAVPEMPATAPGQVAHAQIRAT